ncbi:MAG TPA: hypothetical protein VFB80_06185 [Pirellulaceae bacterium]|nr:hypothetical protein [Pirellulaceae bacterium]
MSGGARSSVAAGLLLVFLCAQPRTGLGQAAWEFSPYRVRVRLALEPVPQLPADIAPQLGKFISARAHTVLGAVWQVESLVAPPALRDELLRGGEISPEAIAAALPDDLAGDKIYLAAISYRAGGYRVAVRELDCRTRQLSDAFERFAPDMADLGTALWDAALEAFTPVAKIETVDQTRITARLRAGGLIVDPASRGLVEKGMVLRPVIRRNDRSGQPAKLGIQVLPWTLLSVNERRDSLLDTTFHSAFRLAIPSRGSSRTERLALLVRPRWPSTRLELRSRGDAAKPLAGYELHIKVPGGESEAEPTTEQKTELIGTTDADGAVELPRSHEMQLLYVRSGKQLLARLPILPGQSQMLLASVVDDDRRLQAEGLILAMQSRALDLVARREILAARFRAKLKAGQLAEARQLLDAYRKMETRQDLSRDLDQYRQRVASTDRITQARIDKLFMDAQQLLTLRPLSDEMLGQLNRELSAAESGGGAKASGS